MPDKLSFHLVSPERELFAGQVDQVIVPGAEGDFGVLPNHAPVMSTIRPGALIVIDEGVKRRVFVDGGFAEVTPAGLTILAEEAIPVEDIDAAELAQSIQDAREDFADANDETHRAAAAKALARLEALHDAVTSTLYA